MEEILKNDISIILGGYMWLRTKLKIIPSLSFDIILAITGLILCLIGLSISIIYSSSVNSIALLLSLVVAFSLYISIHPDSIGKISEINIRIEYRRDLLLVQHIIFCLLFALTVYFTAEPSGFYRRSPLLLICISLIAVLISVEIVNLPKQPRSGYIVCMEIILLGILIRIIPFMVFPGHVWFDPWYHERLVNTIITSHHIPELGLLTYEKLPIMHILYAIVRMVTGLDYRGVFVFFVMPLQVIIQSIFIILIVHQINLGVKIGLLAALIISISDIVVSNELIAYPNALAAIIMIVAIYLIFKSRKRNSARHTVICIILMATLILTHTLTSLALSILLICYFLVPWLLRHLHMTIEKIPIARLTLVLLFIISMLSWWMYASGHYLVVINAFRWALQPEIFHSPAPEAAIIYSASISPVEIVVDRLGFLIFSVFAIVGCLSFLSRRSISGIIGATYALGAIVFSILGSLGSIINLYILPTRWMFMAQALLAIPAAVGIILIINRSHRTRLLIGIIIGVLAFLMCSGSIVNYYSPILSQSRYVRRSLLLSEINSLDTIVDLRSGQIASDDHVNAYLIVRGIIKPGEIYQALNDKDFSGLFGKTIILRKEIVQHPFYADGYTWKLDYNPMDILDSQRINRIFDSGSVFVYFREQP